jgi:hypothetical protein
MGCAPSALRQGPRSDLGLAGGTVDLQHKLDSPTYVISDDKEIREGQEAWSRLKKHMSWSDWTSVGRAHLKGRQAAMREADTNEPTGRRYNQIFGEWLTRHGFDDIDKGDKSRLFEVMEHLDEIETWLATLPTSNRLRLNHPATVLRKWHAKTLGIYARALDLLSGWDRGFPIRSPKSVPDTVSRSREFQVPIQPRARA